MLKGLAEHIAVNRTVAGVHYPIDSWAGAALGVAIGQAILGLCDIKKNHKETILDPLSVDFNNTDFYDNPAKGGLTKGAPYNVTSKESFKWLWAEVIAEKQP